MMRNRLFATLGNIVDVFSSAAATASAVQSGRQPQSRHLRTLGIDAAAFREINQR